MAGINNSWFMTISEAFTKGFVGGYNQIFTPTSYSNYLRNCRLENQWICMRDWFRIVTPLANLWYCMKLKATERFLYALILTWQWAKLYKIIGSSAVYIQTVSSRWQLASDVDIVTVWELVIILSKWESIYRYHPDRWVHQVHMSHYPSLDGGTYPDTHYSASTWVYYSWFVFLNEIDSESWKPTNRVILSHEVNRDQDDWISNATNYSARTDADDLIIPYKLILPSSVQAMVSTQQNLYIFCQESVQYLNREILSEYATTKTLRSLPLAAGNTLMNRNCCVAAGNYVFFMCKDKHVRSLWYTQGIYDPQIADLTDTQFWIQKRINDNISDNQYDAFAFFNKQDYTVEFHLNWIDGERYVLIRDLQHQQWLIDTWKNFGAMENYEWERESTEDESVINGTVQTEPTSWVAHVVAWWNWDGRDGFYYQNEAKYDSVYDADADYWDDTNYQWQPLYTKINPIEFEYNTVNIALGEVAEWKLFNWVRLTGAINMYVWNTDISYDTNTAMFEVNVYVDGKQVCNKKIDRQQLYDTYQRLQIEVWWPETEPLNPESARSIIKYRKLLFPIDLVLDQWMVRRKWKRIRVQIKSKTPWADLYLSWLSLRATPIGHFDLSDKF